MSTRTLTDAVERTSYDVSLHPLEKAPEGITTEPYDGDVGKTKSPEEVRQQP